MRWVGVILFDSGRIHTRSVASADLQGIMSSDSLSPLADEVMCCCFEVCEGEVSLEMGQKQS